MIEGPNGSGSRRSKSMWIRIRNTVLQICEQKLVRNGTYFSMSTVLWSLYDFLSLKIDVNVPSKSNKKKTQKLFLLSSWKPLTKRAGSGTETGSESPDQYQTVTDPQHCWLGFDPTHPKYDLYISALLQERNRFWTSLGTVGLGTIPVAFLEYRRSDFLCVNLCLFYCCC